VVRVETHTQTDLQHFVGVDAEIRPLVGVVTQPFVDVEIRPHPEVDVDVEERVEPGQHILNRLLSHSYHSRVSHNKPSPHNNNSLPPRSAILPRSASAQHRAEPDR